MCEYRCIDTYGTHRRHIKEHFPHSRSQLWYQLYIFKDRQFTHKLIKRAEKSDYKALVITVDSCQIGNRESSVHNKFSLPDGIRTENLIDEGIDSTRMYLGLPCDPGLS